GHLGAPIPSERKRDNEGRHGSAGPARALGGLGAISGPPSHQSWSTMIPATAMTAPRTVASVTRSPRNSTPRGIANSGAVAESTAPMATPAYFRLATKSTELAAVTMLSTPMRRSGPRPLWRRAAAAPRVHGVSHSRREASGSRMAWAVSGSISRSGGFIITVEIAHAADARTAVHTPHHSRSGPAPD